MQRRGSMLAQEEFAYVTMLSSFHLTVEYDTSVVKDLKAEADANGNPRTSWRPSGRAGDNSATGDPGTVRTRRAAVPAHVVHRKQGLQLGNHAEMLYHSNLVPNPVVADAMIRLLTCGIGYRHPDQGSNGRLRSAPTPSAPPSRYASRNRLRRRRPRFSPRPRPTASRPGSNTVRKMSWRTTWLPRSSR